MKSMIKQFGKRSVVTILIAAQLAMVANFVMFPPKRAEAIFGIGDFNFNTEVGNWYDIFKDIGLAAAERIAINYANKYLTRFVDKLLDKYRIKDYLNYEKVLSGYYLNKFVYENVDDPDLRAIYGIIARDINRRATVTDSSGRTQPVLAALKEKLDKYYYGQGGINSNKIYYPGADVTDREYFASARAYFANPPIFTQNEVYGEYGRLLATSQGASAAEIANSNGLKNDRSSSSGSPVPYICNGFSSTPNDYVDVPHDDAFDPNLDADPRSSAQACVAHGGEWQVDKLGTVQSVIQNPSAFIHDFATNGIKSIFEANFGIRDNIYTTIGSLLGNFIFNKLNLDKAASADAFDGTLNDGGSLYEGDGGNVPMPRGIDVDGDNIPDGQDNDEDGVLATLGETCFHGGTAPNCTTSSNAVTSPYFTPICRSIDEGVRVLTEFTRFIDTYAGQLEDGGKLKGVIIGQILLGPVGAIFGGLITGGSVDNFVVNGDSDVWARRAGEVSSTMDNIINNIQSYRSSYFDTMEFSVSRYASYMSKVVQSLQSDGQDLDLAGIGSSGGGGLENLMKKSGYTLRYLTEAKNKIGKCENPNLKALSEIPATPADLTFEDILPGEGACVRFITVGAATYQGSVADAVNQAVLEAERTGLADLPATRGGNIEAFRDLVISEINKQGNEGSTAYNGNCNLSPNQVAIRSGAQATGEAYDIVREQDDKTIKESARINYVGEASWTFFTTVTQ